MDLFHSMIRITAEFTLTILTRHVCGQEQKGKNYSPIKEKNI